MHLRYWSYGPINRGEGHLTPGTHTNNCIGRDEAKLSCAENYKKLMPLRAIFLSFKFVFTFIKEENKFVVSTINRWTSYNCNVIQFGVFFL